MKGSEKRKYVNDKDRGIGGRRRGHMRWRGGWRGGGNENDERKRDRVGDEMMTKGGE